MEDSDFHAVNSLLRDTLMYLAPTGREALEVNSLVNRSRWANVSELNIARQLTELIKQALSEEEEK